MPPSSGHLVDWKLWDVKAPPLRHKTGQVRGAIQPPGVLVGSAGALVETALQPSFSLRPVPLLPLPSRRCWPWRRPPVNLPLNLHLGVCFPGAQPTMASTKCTRSSVVKGRRERVPDGQQKPASGLVGSIYGPTREVSTRSPCQPVLMPMLSLPDTDSCYTA